MAETVLITGATSAIGGALAREYAASGVTLYLHGRNAQRLQEVAAACQAQGAKVVTTRLDVRDFTALRVWLEELDPLDLVIINAGMNTHIGPNGEPEPWDEVEALLDVNLKAAMVIAHAVLPAMRARGPRADRAGEFLGRVFWPAGNAHLFGHQSRPQGLRRGAARLARAGGDSGQCGDAGLCEVVHVRRHAGAEAVSVVARSRGKSDPARFGAGQGPHQFSVSAELGHLVAGGFTRWPFEQDRALAGVWSSWRLTLLL